MASGRTAIKRKSFWGRFYAVAPRTATYFQSYTTVAVREGNLAQLLEQRATVTESSTIGDSSGEKDVVTSPHSAKSTYEKEEGTESNNTLVKPTLLWQRITSIVARQAPFFRSLRTPASEEDVASKDLEKGMLSPSSTLRNSVSEMAAIQSVHSVAEPKFVFNRPSLVADAGSSSPEAMGAEVEKGSENDRITPLKPIYTAR